MIISQVKRGQKMRYYLKRCGSQELGSVKDGKAQRGRYLLISKEMASAFPPLSKSQLNDSAVIAILPLFSDKKVYCKFVYHNSRYAAPHMKKKHSEYRLYLTKSLENDRLLFSYEDIIILRPVEIPGDDDVQTVFLLDFLSDRNQPLYKELNNVIESSEIRGDYAVYDGHIQEFEQRAEERMQTAYDVVTSIDDDVMSQIEKSDMSSLFNSVSFRDFVMFGYETLCAITGTVIRHEKFFNLEAAHIIPKQHGGLYLPSNGIALCRDMHWAFDKGFFTVDTKYKVIVHPKTTSEWLIKFNNSNIRVPKDPFFRPAKESLEYHNDNVFGLFLFSGKL